VLLVVVLPPVLVLRGVVTTSCEQYSRHMQAMQVSAGQCACCRSFEKYGACSKVPAWRRHMLVLSADLFEDVAAAV
jgi:hypothetical protein